MKIICQKGGQDFHGALSKVFAHLLKTDDVEHQMSEISTHENHRSGVNYYLDIDRNCTHAKLSRIDYYRELIAPR
jgi:hypothetical protein